MGWDFVFRMRPYEKEKLMTSEEILLDVEERMDKAVAKLKSDLAGIRTGRANPGLVDSLRVEAYGSPVPIKQLATIAVPEPTQIVIKPFDPGTLKDIEKAIVASDLGFNPQNDGKLIRINIPPLSQEVRQKLVKRIKELTEEAKVAIRNIRRDGNKLADAAEKAKEMSEDDAKRIKEKVDELLKAAEKQMVAAAAAREKDVMEE